MKIHWATLIGAVLFLFALCGCSGTDSVVDAGDGTDELFATGDGFRLLNIDDGNSGVSVAVGLVGLTLIGGTADPANSFQPGAGMRHTKPVDAFPGNP